VGGLLILTALGQSVYLATAPILGRLYTPEAFGLYGLFYSFTVTAAVFTCLNYDLAIPAARNDAEADGLSIGALQAAAALSATSGAAAMAFAHLDLFGFGVLPWWTGVIVAVTLFLQALIQVLQSWQVRRQATPVIGQAGISLNFARGGAQVAAGAAGAGWWGLGWGEAVGRLAGVVHLATSKTRWTPPSLAALGRVPWSILARYRRFPLVLMPAQGLDVIVSFLQIVGLTWLFGVASLGQYFLMRRTLDLPVAFAFRSLGDVFYSRMADMTRVEPQRLPAFYARAFVVLLGFGAAMGLPVMIWGPQLFEFVFGSNWGQAGLLAAVTMPSVIMNLAVAPASRIFGLTRLASLRYAFTGINAVGSAVVIAFASVLKADLVTTVAGLSAVVTLGYGAYFVAGFVASRNLIQHDPAL
jgi:O-antigen/teichoic acid export membrane protein